MHRSWQWVVDDCDVRIGVTTSRRDRTTSTLVVADGHALLVDPSWDPDELAGLAADVAAAGIEVALGFATHAHHDHLLWHPALGSAPRLASPAVARQCATDRDAIVAGLGPDWPAELADLVGRVDAVGLGAGGPDAGGLGEGGPGAVAGTALDWPGPEVRLLTHDAHSPGHTALWLPEQRVLIAGDMLSDVELPLLEDSNPAAYAAGLARLREPAAQARVLIPGHGRIAADGAAALRWAADQAYLSALTRGRTPVDDRLRQPGMAQAHAANLATAAAELGPPPGR